MIVDFNHPLAGQDIEYSIKINKLIEKDEEKLKNVCRKLYSHLSPTHCELAVMQIMETYRKFCNKLAPFDQSRPPLNPAGPPTPGMFPAAVAVPSRSDPPPTGVDLRRRCS